MQKLRKPLFPFFVLSPLFLAACAVTAPTAQVNDQVATKWYSPLPTATAAATGATVDLPHQGSVKALSDWWQSLGDPLLVELITSAQAASPSVTAAASRIAQARSAVVDS